jgi:predicted DCC family thiol-disulfide oxidoreductase YuxK
MPAILIYDGLCPFCARSARRMRDFVGAGRLDIVALEAPGAMELHRDLSHARALGAVQLLLENGYLCEGAEAAFNALALRPGLGVLKFAYYLPGLRQLADFAYKVVARNRRRCRDCAG